MTTIRCNTCGKDREGGTYCPFCGSSIHEKIDFYEEPEEEGQEE